MSCEQVEEFDVTVAAKDQGIAQLKLQLAERSIQKDSLTLPTDDSAIDSVLTPPSVESRKDGASPIGMFSG